jgi:hypothetical protein
MHLPLPAAEHHTLAGPDTVLEDTEDMEVLAAGERHSRQPQEPGESGSDWG